MNAPGRNRTYNLGIKSALLCQLSYGCVPAFSHTRPNLSVGAGKRNRLRVGRLPRTPHAACSDRREVSGRIHPERHPSDPTFTRTWWLLLLLLALTACEVPTSPRPCSLPEHFTWRWVPLTDRSGQVIDSLQIGWCIQP